MDIVLNRTILVVVLATCLEAAALAGYPETGGTCVNTGGKVCTDLGNTECFLQGTGGCSSCSGGADLPQKTCVQVVGGVGCPTAGNPIYCGFEGSGTCTGNTCNSTFDGFACSAIYGC
jgi:hypothetical protein